MITLQLARMRLYAFVRTGRVIPALLSVLVVVGILYGGGHSSAGEAYGLSAFIVMPLVAWQSKLILDTESDTARRLYRVTTGPRRELAAGLVAAAFAGWGLAAVALVEPWVLGSIDTDSVTRGVAYGLWAHLLVVPPAVALGALTSRAVTRTVGVGALALVGGWLVVAVVGLHASPFEVIGPPLMSVARTTREASGLFPALGLSAWVLAWTATALAGYAVVRRTRA